VQSSSNNRVCSPYVCSDSPFRALEYFRDQHSQIQPRSPLTAILKTMQERFTVPPARAIGVASVVRWKQHRTNGALSPRTTGIVTTSKSIRSPFAPVHIHQPKLMAAPRDTGFLLSSPKNQSVFTFSCCFHASILSSPPFNP
jgi:hypothetical protein